MTKFRKKIVHVEASQWFRHGDHPNVTVIPLGNAEFERLKNHPGQRAKLGWLATPQGGHVVHPGDWVIKHENGEFSTCNALSFQRIYEAAEPHLEFTNAVVTQ